MRIVSPLRRLALCAVISLLLTLPMVALGQGQPTTLLGRAVLPANTLADGQRSGQALGKVVNGLNLPFDSQPVGSVNAILPGDYAGAWWVLSEGVFDSPAHSKDYLLRIYTVQLDWREAQSGDGTVNVVDWITLADPAKKVTKPIQNASSATRELTGADFDPRAFQRVSDGSVWVAEASGPSLLHFSAKGKLLAAPVPLGAGAVQGMTKLPDNKTLIIAQQASGQAALSLVVFDTTSKTPAPGKEIASVPLSSPANVTSGLAAINDHQALLIEQDKAQNKAAKFKQIFLVDFGANPAAKTPLADLLNIVDKDNISTAKVDAFQPAPDAYGLGSTFKFPFANVSALYAIDAQTLIVVNDNNVPFGLGRSAKQADDTEYIEVHIAQTLNINPAFAVPH